MADSVKTLSVYLNLRSKEFQTGLRKMERRLNKFGKTMSNIGASMTRNITLPMVAAGGGAIKLAADFEQSMTKIQTLVGLPAQEVENLKSQVLDLAGTTAQAPKELADGLYFLTSAGLDAESAMKALESVSKGVASGLGSQTDLAKVAAAAQNAYGEDVMSASDALDVFGSMVRTGMFEASELAGVLGQQLGLASNLGISMEELGAMISTYTRTTGDATSATTGLSGIMMSFAKITPQAERALQAVGLSVEEVRKSIGEQGLQHTLLMMQERFQASGVDLSAFFSKSQALKGVLGVLGNQTDDYIGILDELEKSQGFVNNAFETASEDSMFKFNQAMSKLKVAGIELGNAIMPLATKIIEKITQIATTFSSMSEETRRKVIKIAAAFALLGPAFSILGMLSTATATLIGYVRSLGVAMKLTALVGALFNPLTYVFVAIGLIITGLIINFEKLKQPIVDVVNWMVSLYNENMWVKKSIEAIIYWFKMFKERTILRIKQVVDAAKNLGKVLLNLVDKEKRKKAIDDFYNDWKQNQDEFKTSVQESWDEMQHNIENREFSYISKEDLDNAIKNGKEWGKNFAGGVKDIITNMSDSFSGLLFGGGGGSQPKETETTGGDTIHTDMDDIVLTGILDPDVEGTKSKWDTIAEGIGEALSKVKLTAEDLGQAVSTVFTDMADSSEMSLKDMAKAVYNNIRNIIKMQIQAAMAGYAKSVMLTQPFPANVLLAAAAPAVVGGLFNSILPPLAEGGLATGMTAAIVGDHRGASSVNPEVIAPLDKLKSMLGGMGTGRLHGVISGDDILLSTTRTTLTQNRVSGSVTNF